MPLHSPSGSSEARSTHSTSSTALATLRYVLNGVRYGLKQLQRTATKPCQRSTETQRFQALLRGFNPLSQHQSFSKENPAFQHLLQNGAGQIFGQKPWGYRTPAASFEARRTAVLRRDRRKIRTVFHARYALFCHDDPQADRRPVRAIDEECDVGYRPNSRYAAGPLGGLREWHRRGTARAGDPRNAGRRGSSQDATAGLAPGRFRRPSSRPRRRSGWWRPEGPISRVRSPFRVSSFSIVRCAPQPSTTSE